MHILKRYKIKKRICLFRRRTKNKLNLIGKKLQLMQSKFWHRYNYVIYYTKVFLVRYRSKLIVLLLAAMWLMYHMFLSSKVAEHIADISVLKNITVSAGCALIGLSILSFSLVMVAMQITVDKLPNELFRRFNNDLKLKFYFVLMFFISLGFTGSSLFLTQETIKTISSILMFLIIFMLYVIFSTYKRASQLIDPILQMKILMKDLEKYTKQFEKMYKRHIPILKTCIDTNKDAASMGESEHPDMLRLMYIKTNSSIINTYGQYIEYFISISSIYAKTKDYKIAAQALQYIININRMYISIKGKTFFNDDPFIENPWAVDNFINYTLEKLRIELSANFAKRDELQIENVLNTFAGLANLYLDINYANNAFLQCKHSKIACIYLINGMKKALDNRLDDVVMKSLRHCEIIFCRIVSEMNPNEVIPCIDGLFPLATKALNCDAFPCAMNFVSLLASIQKNAIISNKTDKRTFFESILKDMYSISSNALLLNDAPFFQKQKTILDPYFSASVNNGFLQFFIQLTDELCKKSHSKENDIIIQSIYEWVISQPRDANIVETSLKSKSLVNYDIVSWYAQITCCLMRLSLCKAPNQFFYNRLREASKSFIGTITSLMGNPQYITELHQYDVHSKLLMIAAQANNLGIFEEYQDLLINCLLNSLQKTLDADDAYCVVHDLFVVLVTIIIIGNGCKTNRLIEFITNNKDKILKSSNFKIQYILKDIVDGNCQMYSSDIYAYEVLASLNRSMTLNVVYYIANIFGIEKFPYIDRFF